MRTSSLEPGLLSVFRLFTGLRLGLAIIGLAWFFLITSIPNLPRRPHLAAYWLSLADTALLMAYLSWPALQRWLRQAFLPIGLAISAVGPIFEGYLAPRLQNGQGFGGNAAALQIFLTLFIPLILISWQYNFRTVVLFSLGTALLDWALIVVTMSPLSISLIPLVGILFLRTFSYIMVGYMVVRLMSTQREQRQALAGANMQLAHYAATLEHLATSRERNRLARELHDTLAHSLSGVAVQLEAVKTLWEDSPQAALAMLDRSLAATRSGLTETRRALQALRASPLEDLGLALAIRSLAESVAARNGLALQVEMPESLENLSPDVEQGIYRVAQEALENVALHAQASKVQVRLSQADGLFNLTISDDGRGFEMESVDAANQFGLQGMRERTEMLGGSLEVNSQPGIGTTIRLAWEGQAWGGSP